MARVPLIQEQDHPEFAELIEKFRAGRRGRLVNIPNWRRRSRDFAPGAAAD